MKKLLFVFALIFATLSYSQIQSIRKPAREISKPIALMFNMKDIKGNLADKIQNQMKINGESFDKEELLNVVNYINKVGAELDTLSSTGPFNPTPEPQYINIKIGFKWTSKKGRDFDISVTISWP